MFGFGPLDLLVIDSALLAIGSAVGATRATRGQALTRKSFSTPLFVSLIPVCFLALFSLLAVIGTPNESNTLLDWIQAVLVLGIASIIFLWCPYALGLFLSHRLLRLEDKHQAQVRVDSEDRTDLKLIPEESNNPYQPPLT